MTKHTSFKKVLFSFLAVMALCLCTFASSLIGAPVFAHNQEITTLSNLNFAQNNNLQTVYSTPTGWQKGFPESTATSGAINIEYYDKDTLYLEQSELPSKLDEFADSHILMINAKNKTTKNSNIPEKQYYTNNSSLKLEAYSTYKIVVWTQVTTSAQASIYLTGLENNVGFERINVSHASIWRDFTFYITTGINSEEVKLELWLGSKPVNTSNGAVFFDNIKVFQTPKNMAPEVITSEDKWVSTPTSTEDRTKYINLDNRQLAKGIDELGNEIDINADFEINDLSSWSKVNEQMKVGTFAEVLDLTTNSEASANYITNVGTDLTGGTKALVLYTNDDVKSYFGLKSSNISVPVYSIFKISVNVKVADLDGGSAYVKFVENDILDAEGNKIEKITPTTNEISISSNSENALLNNYTTCTFYIKARSLYNSSFKLHLCLGSIEAETSGVVAFDNILVEEITNEQFDSVSDGSSIKKINLQSTEENFGITNATFNTVQKTNDTTFPIIPTSWTHETADENSVYYGIVNTNQTIFNKYYSNFGGYSNPGNPNGFLNVDKDTNNVLLMSNISNTYQTITSSNFDVAENKYYKLSFAYKLVSAQNKGLLNVYVEDNNQSILYSDENIFKTATSWTEYVIYVSTNAHSNNLNITIGLGNEQNLVSGRVYLDNIVLEEQSEMTKEEYTALADNYNVLDFQEGNFNLFKENASGIHTPLKYTGTLERGEQPESFSEIAYGGIIDGKNNDFNVENSENNKNSLKYMMMIQTLGNVTYSMKATDELSLTSGNYYKFTVDIKTIFNGNIADETEEFGAEFGLTGIDENLKGIISEDWQTYTIYVSCTTDTKVNLRYALNSANLNTTGLVFFDNYKYETIDADTFNVDHTQYSELGNYLFVGDTDVEIEDESSSTSPDYNYIWYVIPTLILAVALVLALIAYLMKKVKINKWEKRKVNEYDRERTVYRDVVRADAEKLRDSEVKELKLQAEQLKQDILTLEEKHQERLKEKRTNRSAGVSKQAEKEFKSYAKMHTALENKLANINKEIENKNTPEYLLSIQHKIAVEKAKQERINKEKAYSANKKKRK